MRNLAKRVPEFWSFEYSLKTYAELITNFLVMFERLIDWIVRLGWVDSLELRIIFLHGLDRLL